MLATAFTLLGASVTWLEVLAFWLALGCVVCNTLEIHWGWPLAIVSSALYAWLFWTSRLYGDVAVQAYFVVTSAWGWYQWLFARARLADGAAACAPDARLRIATLGLRQRGAVALLWCAAWPLVGVFLARCTDTDVPYFDAFPTTGSLIGQVLLGLKLIDSWPVWLLVNVVSVGLYAYKALWLTALLYVVFAALSLAGWWRWTRGLRVPQPAPPPLVVVRDAG